MYIFPAFVLSTIPLKTYTCVCNTTYSMYDMPKSFNNKKNIIQNFAYSCLRLDLK